jgi:hypothetical protein
VLLQQQAPLLLPQALTRFLLASPQRVCTHLQKLRQMSQALMKTTWATAVMTTC